MNAMAFVMMPTMSGRIEQRKDGKEDFEVRRVEEPRQAVVLIGYGNDNESAR